MKKKRSGLTQSIFIMLFSGAFFGTFLNLFLFHHPIFSLLVNSVLDTGSILFLASLKMLVVPLVFISLVCGVASLDNTAKLGRLGFRSFAFYIVTTAIAIALAIFVALVVKPGVGFNLELKEAFELTAAPSLKETLIGLFPSNPLKALAEGYMLQIILFALFIGFGILSVSHEKKKPLILPLFEEANSVIMFIVSFLMKLAPYGVFMIMAKVFAENGLQALKPLLGYFLCVSFTLLLHVLVTHVFILKVLASVSPLMFFRKMKSCLTLAFSTASSSVTLPVTIRSVVNDLGVDKSIASFTLSLGSTLNMDGSAIMQGVATVFIAQAYGIDIGLSGYLTVILMATLSSIGTAGAPGVALITLAMVLSQVGLPVEGIGLILGVDRLLDMMRTAVNVAGDAAISCALAEWDGKLDTKKFSDEVLIEP